MRRRALQVVIVLLAGLLPAFVLWAQQKSLVELGNERQPKKLYPMNPKPIASDASVRYDYDIVYVRAPRKGDTTQIQWADVFMPTRFEPGSDLILLHPDGSEEVLVRAGQDSVADPFVSFDAQWVYYTLAHNLPRHDGKLQSFSADIFKLNLATRKVVQLTHQEFTPNTGVADAKLPVAGVFNTAPCPLPGGRLIFTSNRNGFIATKSYRKLGDHPEGQEYTNAPDLQMFVMNDDGSNVEEVGFLNINGALHPTILKDGRIAFSTFESEGLRDVRMWGIWAMSPDGTNWAPFVSALGPNADTADHFMTQLSDEKVIWEEYYFEQTLGFGTFYKMNANAPEGYAFFGSASRTDARNIDVTADIAALGAKPFSPSGLELITPWALPQNGHAYLSDYRDPKSQRVGRVTHPSAAPDNHLLAVWSPGPVHGFLGGTRFGEPAADSGIYLIKGGKRTEGPGEMLLIKNDPRYNEQWPRAVVSYQRIYGVPEPKLLSSRANDGKSSPHLAAGSPYGLVGTSSLYKRETYPFGEVPAGKVTAQFPGGGDRVLFPGGGAAEPAKKTDPFENLGALFNPYPYGNWFMQGADDGKYTNDDVHAIRILITEPTTDPALAGKDARRWWNIANERFRILGEIPVRKFKNGKQPLDPDGNPDTSFLVKIPADVAWTFQTLDKNGMVLNMAETWHQIRPGETRTDCGGCHAHSQTPTKFEATAAAKRDYPVFDLTRYTSLLTAKANDQSNKQWDDKNETGLRFQKSVKTAEFYRDIKPILERSCVACHTQKWSKPAGNLVLDDEQLAAADENLLTVYGADVPGKVPGTYLRLALDPRARWGNTILKIGNQAWSVPQASRYVRYFQSRRSLLAWKIYGRRLDGFRDDDFAHETVAGDPSSIVYHGEPYGITGTDLRQALPKAPFINLAFSGTAMPPPEAVAGRYVAPDGKTIKVQPLSDEDRRTITRWIDLGCPIDLDFDPQHPDAHGHGWMEDDNRPTLVVTEPRVGKNEGLTRILVGMHDYDSGLNLSSFAVTADFALDGNAPGTNLAAKFKPKSQGVWGLVLAKPLRDLPQGRIVVAIKDNAGNISRVERTFSVGPAQHHATLAAAAH